FTAFNKLVVLQSDMHAGYDYGPFFYPVSSFIKAWGGDLHPNNPVGEGRWFYQFEENGPFPWQDGFSNPGYIPKHAITDDYNLDSLVNVKLAIKNYYLSNDSLEKLNHQNYIISKMDIYTKSFK